MLEQWSRPTRMRAVLCLAPVVSCLKAGSGEGPGPEYGASAWVDLYVRSAAMFQFVRCSAVAESVVWARGVGVAVDFLFERVATHAGSCEVV